MYIELYSTKEREFVVYAMGVLDIPLFINEKSEMCYIMVVYVQDILYHLDICTKHH